MIGPSDSFVWGGAGAQLTPSQIDAQRKIAQAMMAQGGDFSPVQSWTQGAARVAQAMFGGMMARDANDAVKNNQAAEAQLISSVLGGGGPASSISTAPSSISTPMGRTSIPVSTSGKIYENDEPSPLDPPSGTDRDAAIRTVLAEAGDQGPVGMNAVASVIRNRAVNGGFGGDTPSGVVTAPNQFEPWNTAGGRARMAAIDPNGAQYAAAGGAVDSAYFGNDPTNGATHFYGPQTQAVLGRRPPSWDNGTGVDIGGHRFFGGAPQTTQGVAIPGQPAPAAATVNPALVRAMASPYISDGTKKILGLVLNQQMEAQQRANDPMRQAQLEKLQLETQNLRSSGGVKSSLTPIYGEDAQGNVVLLQPTDRGTVVQPQLPDGIKIRSGVDKIDLGTHFQLRDKRTGQVVGVEQKNLKEAEAAKAEGKAQGAAVSEYQSIASKMPGLEKVVKDLDDISNRATYTYAGQALDAATRQLGFAPRDAAIARAEYTSKVDNQILPLLRDTFGAQFTQKEGETLRATLGDPDKSPQEKQAVLRAFIEQKRRDVEALASRAGQSAPASSASSDVAQGDGGWADFGGVKIRRKQ